MGANQQVILSFHGAASSGGASGLSVPQIVKSFSLAQNASASITPSAGSTLVACLASQVDATGQVITDSAASTAWTQCDNTTSAGLALEMWYKPNVANSALTVTGHGGTANAISTLYVMELKGVSTSSPFDNANDSTNAGDTVTSPTITIANSSSVIIAFSATNDSSVAATININQGGTIGTYALAAGDATNAQTLNSASGFVGDVVTKITVAASSQAHGWAFDPTITTLSKCIIGAFH